jgi:hypothetical protein
MDNIYCTDVDMNLIDIDSNERDTLKALTEEIISMPVLSWPEDATTPQDIDQPNMDIINRILNSNWIRLPEEK